MAKWHTMNIRQLYFEHQKTKYDQIFIIQCLKLYSTTKTQSINVSLIGTLSETISSMTSMVIIAQEFKRQLISKRE